MTDTPKPKLHWFQFSLRTLLVQMLLVSIMMSWVSVKMQQARRKREAVEAVEKLGGKVTWYLQSGLEMLRERGVDFSGTAVTDAGLEHLKRLSQLRLLWLSNTAVTDAGLEHLTGLNQLEELYLDGTQVSAEGVKNLQHALPNCKIHR